MKPILSFITVLLLLSLGLSARATVTGQWDFNSSNLVATIGAPLAYYDDRGTERLTKFTTATIGTNTAIVMNFPGCSSSQGYIMTNGIAPNGGGMNANQYSLIMDIMFPTASSGAWRALLQTDMANANDGELFVNPGNGIGNYGVYAGSILPNTWHRVAFVVDLSSEAAANGTNLWKYIDGQLVGTQGNDGGLFLDDTFSMGPTVLLFTDDNGETKSGFVNSIQIHDVALSSADILALGAATAAGIPTNIPSGSVTVTVLPASQTDVEGMTSYPFSALASLGSGTYTYQWQHNGVVLPGQTNSRPRLVNLQSSDAGNYTVVVNDGVHSVTSSPPTVLTVNPAPETYIKGQWDFSQSNLLASCGQPLNYFDAAVAAGTSFGTTTSFGISDIAGQPANVMYCAPSTYTPDPWGGYIMTHGVSPNGGGTNVNQCTLILDLLYPSSTSGYYRALWQTDPANTNDADAFFNPNDSLGISQQYDGTLIPDVWHRVVLAFDLTKGEVGKYIDGTNTVVGSSGLHEAQDIGGVDGRWSLSTSALLVADEDSEVQPVYLSSVQIRSGRMTDAAVAAMGSPTAGKIPGLIKATLSGTSVVIHWTGAVLEGAPNLGGSWSEVTAAAHPHVITSPTGTQFFRVRR